MLVLVLHADLKVWRKQCIKCVATKLDGAPPTMGLLKTLGYARDAIAASFVFQKRRTKTNAKLVFIPSCVAHVLLASDIVDKSWKHH